MAESTDVRLARLEEKFTGMAKDIAEIKKMLKGNGQPGIVQDVENLKTKFAELDGGKKMIGAILGSSLFTGIAVLLIQKIFS